MTKRLAILLGFFSYALLGFFVTVFVIQQNVDNLRGDFLDNFLAAFWPVQSFAFGKRSRRIFVVRIAQPGMYEIQFRNPAALKVKSTNLLFSRRVQEPLPADQISIYIH